MQALLSLAGILYAANPTPFATVNTPIGVAASGTDLIVTEYCGRNVDTLDCQGNVTLLATLPGINDCREEYVTIAPSQSANAGFTPRDIFVTQGPAIFKVTGGTVTPFALMPACGQDETGITFDHVGTFGYNMIVTCDNGLVWQVDGTGIPTFIADAGTHLEGPAIPPLSFGPYGGQILAADEDSGGVHAIDNAGNITYDLFSNYGAEGVLVIPSAPCTFCDGGGAQFQAIQNFQSGNVYQYPLTDFAGLGGNILVTSEFGGGTALVTWDGANYNTVFFDDIPGGEFEGASFADCDIPPASPTPTPEQSPTPTATPTATARYATLLLHLRRQLLPRQPLPPTPTLRYGDRNRYLYSNSYRDSHLHADSNPGGGGKSNRYTDCYGHCNSYLYSNSYRDGHLHADANPGGESNPYAYRYGDRNGYLYSNSYCHSHVHTDPNPRGESDAHSYG